MSPVVGMVLVLGISVVGIAAILYWGLPAIDEMKANVEHKSVEAQFQELDASIKELVAGTTEKTAKRWQPTLNRGSVLLINETEGWVYATEMYHATKDHSFVYQGFENSDNAFTVVNVGEPVASARVVAYRITGTTTGQDLQVFKDGALWAAGENWPVGQPMALTLKDAQGQDVPIKNATIRFRIFESNQKIAEAFYVPTGRVDYRLEAGLGTKTVSQNNGAVITGDGYGHALINPPPIPPISTSGEVPRFFARAVLLNATGSFGGNDRFDVLVTLYSTSTLASYDCATVAKTDCVESSKLFFFGDHAPVWKSYLTNTGRGYKYVVDPTYGHLVDRRADGMGYTLLQSTVQMTAG
ncbi:MAG TPA: hypothetical protein VFH78_06735 [Candidatus Thermoplasmatota archaeon]|nr:hypothetical protein [Candidatus Thermoplasmatota archaeon]